MSPSLALLTDTHPPAEQARLLAESLAIPIVNRPLDRPLLLRFTAGHLELCAYREGEAAGALWVDFTQSAMHRRHTHPGQELLVQAAKVRHMVAPMLVDATAGLGRDGFLLAAAGWRVRMLEHNPIVAALLRDGLERAADSPRLAAITERIHLTVGNALEYFRNPDEQPDVIYLDPMFPERTKSAKVKQNLQLLQLLESNADQPEQLLHAALAIQPRKVVVKRPLKGPPLSELTPSYMLKGKTVRFDVYVGAPKGFAPSG